jgi:hypothetical protein
MRMGFLLRWDLLGLRKAVSATIPSNRAGESQTADAPVILKTPCNGYRHIQNQFLLMATTMLYQIPYLYSPKSHPFSEIADVAHDVP